MNEEKNKVIDNAHNTHYNVIKERTGRRDAMNE